MADKTIGELPSIANVSDNSLIPVEQNGAAGKMTGAQWRAWAQDTTSSYVAAAQQAADNAANSATAASNSATAANQSASNAANSANGAQSAKTAIENMTVSVETLSAGSDATVTKTTIGGIVNIEYGIPRGATGPQGLTGPQGPVGPQGPKGDTGSAVAVETSGMYYFNVDNDSTSNTYGHLFLTYTGDSPPDFEINEDGHLIWTVEEE